MQPMRHGYTNQTTGDASASTVVKSYRGPAADQRRQREETMLRYMQGRLPVPTVHAAEPSRVTMGFLPGTHGQDLIDAGHAPAVLRARGELLRTVQAIEVEAIPGVGVQDVDVPDVGVQGGSVEDDDVEDGDISVEDGSAEPVLVHGDFGPNNILLDPETFEVTALLDWEFAHIGSPIEDLAWCEWIARTHHPSHRDALAEFFTGYGGVIVPWHTRQTVMINRCLELEAFCRRWDANSSSASVWASRAEATAVWEECGVGGQRVVQIHAFLPQHDAAS